MSLVYTDTYTRKYITFPNRAAQPAVGGPLLIHGIATVSAALNLVGNRVIVDVLPAGYKLVTGTVRLSIAPAPTVSTFELGVIAFATAGVYPTLVGDDALITETGGDRDAYIVAGNFLTSLCQDLWNSATAGYGVQTVDRLVAFYPTTLTGTAVAYTAEFNLIAVRAT